MGVPFERAPRVRANKQLAMGTHSGGDRTQEEASEAPDSQNGFPLADRKIKRDCH